MSDVREIVRAMPKVELNTRFEGTFRKSVLMIIADENEVGAATKNFESLAAAFETPDFVKLPAHIRTYAGWLRHADDLTRLVYDAGVALARENIKYAEISINPVYHSLPGMSFEDFMTAINDGRDRAVRGWGIHINWILTIPREEPRSADDAMRNAASVLARKGGVVGFGLSGSEAAQPAGQFERAFNTAHKKEIPTVAQAGDIDGAEGIKAVLDLHVRRIVDGWGLTEDAELLKRFVDEQIPLVISPSRAVRLGWVASYADVPLRQLYDAGVNLILAAELPNMYGTTLTDEYFHAVTDCGLTLDELQEVSLNAVRASFLPEETKAAMVAEFTEAYSKLMAEA